MLGNPLLMVKDHQLQSGLSNQVSGFVRANRRTGYTALLIISRSMSRTLGRCTEQRYYCLLVVKAR